MPSGAFHSHYWAGSYAAPVDPPLGSSASGGYVPWMTSIAAMTGSVLFAVCAWW